MSQGVLEAKTLLQNVTTGTSPAFDLKAANRYVTFYVIWTGTITAGQVVLETADDAGYTGTWASLATVNYGSNKTDVFVYTGPLRAVRARVSTNVTGGDVTVKMYAN